MVSVKGPLTEMEAGTVLPRRTSKSWQEAGAPHGAGPLTDLEGKSNVTLLTFSRAPSLPVRSMACKGARMEVGRAEMHLPQ